MKVFPKINIGLKVLRKRPDGYHDLETLFYPCKAYCDELEIERTDAFSISIDHCDWDPQKDLTVKAYALLAEEFALPPVSIRLQKGIPVGAGLGGGSADAAAALKLLNGMFSLGLDAAALAARAATLGSDCAFFVYDGPMFGEGRGEILTPFALDLSAYEIRVAIPESVRVSTKEAYAGVSPCGVSNLRQILSRPVEAWRDVLENDFEKSVFTTHPEIPALKEQFYDDGAVYAAMSGSGSAVFGLFRR